MSDFTKRDVFEEPDVVGMAHFFALHTGTIEARRRRNGTTAAHEALALADSPGFGPKMPGAMRRLLHGQLSAT